MASYKAIKAKKLTEGQLDRIEDWTSIYFITYEIWLREPLRESGQNAMIITVTSEVNTWAFWPLSRSGSL